MSSSLLLSVAVLLLCASISYGAENKTMMGAYFANWAQYHTTPYTYTPENLSPIIGKIDQLMYGFLYFDESFNMKLIEPKDPEFISTIVGYKSSNPNLKVIASVGGWNFPSALFSKMASSSSSRTAFINSLKATLDQHSFDGVDLDWEYPCSSPRTDYIKYTCTDVKPSQDGGGKCPDDTDNLLELVKELRQALGSDKLISFAGPGSQDKWKNLHLKEMSQYIDYWHVMTYDYTVSDITDSKITAPNSPLYAPPKDTGVIQWSIDYTIQGYLAAGVPSSQIMVGIPLYGHTWYVPNLSGDDWKKFGLNASIQGQCCGPFKDTYGALYGKGSQLCGTYMYSEIRAAGPDYYFDTQTNTAISYMKSDSQDGWTKAGTWFTYNDKTSIEGITKYINKNNLGGAFIFDTSEDTVDFQTGTFTYELTNAVASGLSDKGKGDDKKDKNKCSPSHVGSCNVCHECCKDYLTNQRDCDACAIINCAKN